LRTSNPLESVFAGVRLRTDVAKRARKRENALYLVFKIVQRLGRNWRALNGVRCDSNGAGVRHPVSHRLPAGCRRRPRAGPRRPEGARGHPGTDQQGT